MQACVVGLGEVYGCVVYVYSVCGYVYLCGRTARSFTESGARMVARKS